MNEKNIDPLNLQARSMKAEGVDAVALRDSVGFGVPRPEYYRKKLRSAAESAGIGTSSAAEA